MAWVRCAGHSSYSIEITIAFPRATKSEEVALRHRGMRKGWGTRPCGRRRWIAIVEIVQRAPDFTMPSDEGRPFTLSKELGQAPVVLEFYVWDFSAVCQGELCSVRDVTGDF